jgi:hypothetical protein
VSFVHDEESNSLVAHEEEAHGRPREVLLEISFFHKPLGHEGCVVEKIKRKSVFQLTPHLFNCVSKMRNLRMWNTLQLPCYDDGDEVNLPSRVAQNVEYVHWQARPQEVVERKRSLQIEFAELFQKSRLPLSRLFYRVIKKSRDSSGKHTVYIFCF